MGLLLICDTVMRWPDLHALYSDDGYFTRDMVNHYYSHFTGTDWRSWMWSLHLLRGELEWAQGLFVAQAVCGAFLMVGFGTRFWTVAAWVLVVSAHIRSPLAITGADYILKLMLFWAMFLPLGKRWSLDSLFARKRLTNTQVGGGLENAFPNWVVSCGTAGYLVQLFMIYFCTGEAKWNQIWWQGEAMHYVLHLDIHCRPNAQQLLQYPFLVRLIAWGTLFIELVLIWLLFSPWKTSLWRLVNLFAYWSFHLGILIWMSIGLFPWICFALWLPLVPAVFWDRVCRMAEQAIPILPPTGIRRYCNGVAQGFCGVMICLVVYWNVLNFDSLEYKKEDIPTPIIRLAQLTAFDQRFQMFGIPPKIAAWFVYEARLKDGSRVDLFRPGNKLEFEKPKSVLLTIPTHNWRQLHRNLTYESMEPFRDGLLEYQVKMWNRSHDEDKQVVHAKLHCYLYETGPEQEKRSTSPRIWQVWNSPTQRASPLLDDLLDRLQDNPNLPF